MSHTDHPRIAGLDLMKSLGLYLVILYHLTFRNLPDSLPGGIVSVLVYMLYPILSMCVPLFFTASGALSLTRPLDLRRNTLRCLHILFLLLFWTGASLIIVLALKGERPGRREFVAIASEMRVGYIQHLWYLPTFLFLTLLTPVLHALRHGPQRIWRYGVILLGVFTFGNMLLADGECLLRWMLGRTGSFYGNRQYFWFVNFFHYHYWYAPIYLALGAFLLTSREALARRRRLAWAAIPLCTVLLGIFALARSACRGSLYDPVFNNYGDPFTLVLTGAVTVLLLEASPGKRLRAAAESLSSCSLGVYLIHWLIIEVLLDRLPAVTNAVYFAPLTALAVLGVSWGLSWLLLRVPIVRNLFTAAPGWLSSFS